MTISKKIREAVYKKYDGHCSYCGKKIEYKEMQVDHLEPKIDYRSRFIGKNLQGEPLFADPDRFDNLMPSCRRCNHYKRAHPLNYFRGMIDTVNERLMKIYIFKVAVDFGVIKIHQFDGLFYFEKIDRGIL